MKSVHSIYRVCIWLPILVPAAVLAVALAVGIRPSTGVVPEIFTYSLFYGGVPYALLAAWATWWVGGRPESQIRRLMLLAPIMMAAVFVLLALAAGLVFGAFEPFFAVAVLGTSVILPLGYGYVLLALLLRYLLGPRSITA